MYKSPKKYFQKLAAAIIIIIIFIIDNFISPDIDIEVFYIISIAVIFYHKKTTIVLFSIFISMLLFTDMFFVHETTTFPPYFYVNKLSSLLDIWIVAFIAIQYGKLQIKNKKQKDERQKAIEEMLFITSHKIRQPVAHILGIANLLSKEEPSDIELKQITEYVRNSAHALDNFTRELTEFMSKENIKIADFDTLEDS